MNRIKKMTIFFFSVSMLFLFWECEESTGPDNQPPEVIITYPADGATVISPIFIKIDITDNSSIQKAVVLVDGIEIGSDSSSPYEIYWNTNYWSDSSVHTLLAKANDKSGNTGQSNLIRVTVSGNQSEIPLLVKPAEDHIFRNTDEISFLWQNLSEAQEYNLLVSKDIDLNEIILNINFSDTSSINNFPQGEYWWKVRGKNSLGLFSNWSNLRKFIIDGPIPPSLYFPDNGSYFYVGEQPQLIWSNSQYSDESNVVISKDSTFSQLDFDQTTNDTTIDISNLSSGTHYWKVKSKNQIGFWGDWSDLFSFVLIDDIIFRRQYDNNQSLDYVREFKPTDDDGFVFVGKTGSPHNPDIFILKTDKYGIKEFSNIILNLKSHDIVQSNDGGFLIPSWTNDNVPKGYLIKVNSQGEELWRNNYNISNNSHYESIQKINNTGYAICGHSYGDNGTPNILLLRLDSYGNYLWHKSYNINGWLGYSYKLLTTEDDGFLIMGELVGKDERKAIVLRTDINGDSLWSKSYGIADNNYAISILNTSEDGSLLLMNAIGVGFYLIKTDKYGNIVSENHLQVGDHYSRLRSICNGINGNYYVTGHTYLNDIFISKLNSQYDQIYFYELSQSSFYESGVSCDGTSDGGVVIAAEKDISNYDTDILLIKTDSEGNTVPFD